MDYDPNVAPDAASWLALDESERMAAVIRHHDGQPQGEGSPRGHAIVHSMVETQLAQRLETVARTVARLQEEGLDRHEAVHAVGSALSWQLHEASAGDAPFDQGAYETALSALTAAEWLNLKGG